MEREFLRPDYRLSEHDHSKIFCNEETSLECIKWIRYTPHKPTPRKQLLKQGVLITEILVHRLC